VSETFVEVPLEVPFDSELFEHRYPNIADSVDEAIKKLRVAGVGDDEEVSFSSRVIEVYTWTTGHGGIKVRNLRRWADSLKDNSPLPT